MPAENWAEYNQRRMNITINRHERDVIRALKVSLHLTLQKDQPPTRSLFDCLYEPWGTVNWAKQQIDP